MKGKVFVLNKRCKACGWHVKEGYELCENCGADLSETVITEAAYQQIQEQERAAYLEAWEANGGKKSGRLGCLIFLVVIASIIAFAFMAQTGQVSDSVLSIPLILIFLVINFILYKMRLNKKFQAKRFYDLNPPRGSMTYCSSCGSVLNQDEIFCGQCGQKRGAQ